ncbi:MAG: ferredoxin family protein [Thermoanaerobacter sp.]|nr:ferredoxin family protein [Thermoanaerobacter sp.]
MIEKIDEARCNGCGLCVEICPMDVFRLKMSLDIFSDKERNTPKREVKAYVAYPEDCMTCFTCELKCPTKAVQVGYAPPERPSII